MALLKFVPSAFKHGVSQADIEAAIDNFIFDEVLEDDPKKPS